MLVVFDNSGLCVDVVPNGAPDTAKALWLDANPDACAYAETFAWLDDDQTEAATCLRVRATLALDADGHLTWTEQGAPRPKIDTGAIRRQLGDALRDRMVATELGEDTTALTSQINDLKAQLAAAAG